MELCVGAFFVDPVGGTLRSDHRYLPIAVAGLNHMAERAKYIYVRQLLYQRALKLVGNEITALAVGALEQRVQNLRSGILGSNRVPERLSILGGRAAGLLLRILLRGLAGQRIGRGLV